MCMTWDMLSFGKEAAKCNGKVDQPLYTPGTSTLKQNKTKHKVKWKSNKERNFRNSHGKIKFLVNDKFSPFLLVT